MLLLPPYPLNHATGMILHKPSVVLWLCVSVWVCMGVSSGITRLFCAHINNNHY